VHLNFFPLGISRSLKPAQPTQLVPTHNSVNITQGVEASAVGTTPDFNMVGQVQLLAHSRRPHFFQEISPATRPSTSFRMNISATALRVNKDLKRTSNTRILCHGGRIFQFFLSRITSICSWTLAGAAALHGTALALHRTKVPEQQPK
jgi:hypothetical protein